MLQKIMSDIMSYLATLVWAEEGSFRVFDRLISLPLYTSGWQSTLCFDGWSSAPSTNEAEPNSILEFGPSRCSTQGRSGKHRVTNSERMAYTAFWQVIPVI
jgi:hypothetical protein